MNHEEDVYFKKVVTLHVGGHALHFRTAQDLFSSHEVDIGTQRLLRSVYEHLETKTLKALDLGCGYGPLGLAAQCLNPDSIIHLVDRDALAIEYARQNAALNGLAGNFIYGSLGYDDVAEADFDLVLSNIPGKAGEPVLTSLLREAASILKPGGMAAIVVVAALEALVLSILSAPGIEITFQKQWHGHTVFHYRFREPPSAPAGSAFERGIYTRKEMAFTFQGQRFPMRTVYGLPEFDSLSYRSELLLQGLKELPQADFRRVLVVNPNQGHTPVLLWKWFQPERILLIDRDLLSLRASHRNLLLNGCPDERVGLRHQVGVCLPEAGPADLIALLLREEEGPRALAAALHEAAALLAPGGRLLAAGSSTAITRLQEELRRNRQLLLCDRQRSRGESMLAMERKPRGIGHRGKPFH